MKKSRQSSNDILAGSSIKHLFTIPMVICIILFALSLSSAVFFEENLIYGYDDGAYGLISTLQSEALRMSRYNITPNYHLSSGYSAPGIELFFGIIFAVLQFNFLLNKKNCYTQLSFAVGRKQLYFNKVFFPVMIASSITVIIKLIAAALNVYYIGFSVNLIYGLIVNILTTLAPFLQGYAIGVLGHMFTARKPEAYLLIASIAFLPEAISGTLDNIFSYTLYGYQPMSILGLGSFTTDVTSYIEDSSDYFPAFEKISLIGELAFSIVSILICVITLILCNHYFVNKFKAEQSGSRGKSRIALVLSCIVIPMLIVHSYSFMVDYFGDVSVSFPTIFVVGLLLTAILSIIFCLIITWSPKKIVIGAIAAGTSIALQIIVMIIGYTGGFGYAVRVPDIQDIESVSITLPFEDMGYMNMENEFFSSGWAYGDTVTMTEEYEFEIVQKIHKTIIADRAEETGAYCEVWYTLKDGSTISRLYQNISKAALDEYLNIWKSQEIKQRLGVLLNVIDRNELYESKKADASVGNSYSVSYADYYDEDLEYDYFYSYPSAISLSTDTVIVSKDYKITDISSLYSSTYTSDYTAFTKELMSAIYKDACTLSAKDWFEPEKELGAIAFESYSDYGSDANTLNMYEHIFYVNSKMINTINVLNKYGYTKYFETEKTVEKAHLVDIKQTVQWIQSIYYEEDMHLPYFAQNNMYISDYLGNGCGYYSYPNEYDWYSDDIDISVEYDAYSGDIYINDEYYGLESLFGSQEAPLPEKEEITDLAVAQKMVDNAYMAYNVGDDGKFLVVKFDDGRCSMLVVPDKTK